MSGLEMKSERAGAIAGLLAALRWAAGRGDHTPRGWNLLLAGIAVLLLGSIVGILESLGYLAFGATIAGLPVPIFFQNLAAYPAAILLIGVGAFRLAADHRAAHVGPTDDSANNPALRALETHWRKIVELSPDAIFLHDGERILFANPATARMMGAESADALVGMPPNEILSPEMRDQVRRNRARMLETGEPLEFQELTYRSLKGEPLSVDSGAAIMTVDGTEMFLVVAHDITARKRAEDATRDSEDRLRRVTDAIPAAIAYVDGDQRVAFANSGLSDLTGIPKENLIGKLVSDVRGKEAYRRAAPHREAVLSGEQPVFEEERSGRDGETTYVRSHYVPHFSNDGEVVGFYALIVDITEEKQTELALRASEARFAKAFNASPNSLIITRVSDSVVIDANDLYLKTIGLSREQIAGKPFVNSVTWADPEKRRKYFDTILKDGGCKDFPAEFYTPSGQLTHVILAASSLVIDGEQCVLHVTQDVTGYKRAEAALRTSETRFQDFAGSASDWLWETDMDLGLSWVSESYFDSSDMSPKDIMGKKPWELRGPHEETSQEMRVLQRYMEKRKPFTAMQISRTDASGRTTHRNISGWPVFSEDGEFLGFRGILSDVTPQVELEYGYRRLVDDSPSAILVQDGEKILFANAASAKLYRAANPRDLIGRPIRSLLHPDELEKFDRRLSRVKDSKQALDVIEQKRVGLDGTPIVVETRGIPIVWQGLPAIMGVQTDITERKAAIEALRGNEARLRQIIDAVPHMVSARDTNGRFLLANRATAQAYDTTVEKLIGAKHANLHPGDPEMTAFFATDREVMESGLPATHMDLKFHDKDGNVHYLDIVKVPYTPPDGEGPAVLCVGMDVTERKATEDKLRQAQKMEAVGQLTGGIAHDFNNLLAVILGNLQLLETRIGGDEKGKKLAETAIMASRRGAALTRQLLSFARQQPLQPEIIDLNGFISDIHELLSRSLGQTHDLHLDKAEGLWNTLTDPAQVQTALLNLVINASHAMPDGGEITLSSRNIRAAPNGDTPVDLAPGDYVAISVTDTGTGMPPDIADRAFEPFFTTKEVGHGTGLGLSMVYGFAEQSRGGVGIDSRQGAGTTVTLYLPREDKPAAAEPPPPKERGTPGPRGQETILVVEDDPDVRDIAVLLLGGMGYHVIEAEDGPTALRIFEQERHIDALFTDMVLPNGMNGSEIAIELCRRQPTLKVLITSGNMELHSGLGREIDQEFAFLRKPYLANDLASHMRTLLDRKEEETVP